MSSAHPDLTILESRVYRGAKSGRRPRDPPRRRPRRPGGLPDRHPPRLHRPPGRAAPRDRDHTCSAGGEGGFIERLREGTWLGHVTEHIALQLQQEAGHDQRRGKTRGTGRPRALQRHLRLRRRGGRPGRRAPRRPARQPPRPPDRSFDFDAELERFLTPGRAHAPSGPRPRRSSRRRLSRDIPSMRLNQAPSSSSGRASTSSASARR